MVKEKYQPLVLNIGLEPIRLSAPAPKAGVAAISPIEHMYGRANGTRTHTEEILSLLPPAFGLPLHTLTI